MRWCAVGRCRGRVDGGVAVAEYFASMALDSAWAGTARVHRTGRTKTGHTDRATPRMPIAQPRDHCVRSGTSDRSIGRSVDRIHAITTDRGDPVCAASEAKSGPLRCRAHSIFTLALGWPRRPTWPSQLGTSTSKRSLSWTLGGMSTIRPLTQLLDTGKVEVRDHARSSEGGPSLSPVDI